MSESLSVLHRRSHGGTGAALARDVPALVGRTRGLGTRLLAAG